MCTIICVLKANSDTEFIVGYNRDKPAEPYLGQDFRILSRNVVGIYDHRAKGIACGFSLRNGIFGSVANVNGSSGIYSRGVLLLEALIHSKNMREAVDYITSKAKTGYYSSANYVLCDGEKIVCIENFKEKVEIYEENSRIVVTNHFKILNNGIINNDTILRKKFVEEYLKNKSIIKLENIIEILSKHEPIQVCRHNITLGSMIVKKSNGVIEIKYSLSNPCLGYRDLQY